MDAEEKKLHEHLSAAQRKGEASIEGTRVEALDPDFILILFFAMVADFIFFILAIFDAAFGLSWVIGIILSIPPTIIIGFWDFYRTGRTERMKEEISQKIKGVKKNIDSQLQKKTVEKATEKIAAKGGGKATAKQAEKVVATKAGKKIILRRGYKAAGTMVAKRGAVGIVGTNIPFIGAFPFYTLWVLLKLRDKK